MTKDRRVGKWRWASILYKAVVATATTTTTTTAKRVSCRALLDANEGDHDDGQLKLLYVFHHPLSDSVASLRSSPVPSFTQRRHSLIQPKRRWSRRRRRVGARLKMQSECALQRDTLPPETKGQKDSMHISVYTNWSIVTTVNRYISYCTFYSSADNNAILNFPLYLQN